MTSHQLAQHGTTTSFNSSFDRTYQEARTNSSVRTTATWEWIDITNRCFQVRLVPRVRVYTCTRIASLLLCCNTLFLCREVFVPLGAFLARLTHCCLLYTLKTWTADCLQTFDPSDQCLPIHFLLHHLQFLFQMGADFLSSCVHCSSCNIRNCRLQGIQGSSQHRS